MGGELGVSVGPDTASIVDRGAAERGAEAVALVADVAQRPRLPEAELARVKANLLRDLAIQQEHAAVDRRRRSSPSSMYGDHPYGRLFPTEAMLSGYTLEQVTRVPQEHFTAGRARLYVAGVFDAAAMEASGAQGVRRLGTRRRRSTPPPKPAAGDRRFRAASIAPDAPQSTVMLGLQGARPVARRLGRARGHRLAARRLVRARASRRTSASRRATPIRRTARSTSHPGDAPAGSRPPTSRPT